MDRTAIRTSFEEFVRARRAHGRRQAALVAVAGLIVGVGAVPPGPRSDRPSGPVDQGLPSVVEAAPRWTADVRSAPVGHAVAVYSGSDSHEGWRGDSFPLVIVGPGDQYRTYDRPEWTAVSSWSHTFLLSPDGRFLLMANMSNGWQADSRLLDLHTGKVRTLTAGAPLAWSPDGRQAILVSYDGDPTSASPRDVEIRVVDVPAGQVRWHTAVAPQPYGQLALAAALSADGSALAVQHGTDLIMRRRAGGGWQRTLGNERLAGPAAWTPDGGRLALTNVRGRLILLDAATGNPVPDQQPATAAPPIDQSRDRLVAWRGDLPVLVAGARVLLLADAPRVLLTAPAGTGELEIATDRIGLPPHHPGRPRPGPFAQRYGHLIAVLGGLALLVALIVAFRLRRGGWISAPISGPGRRPGRG